MPQITVNEIDQSVVTRVVSNDMVKVFCPIISSFGPSAPSTSDLSDTGKNYPIQTFTDVTEFQKAYGYTYPEFDPMDDDYSYMYARELIKRGAAVSVVRINGGSTADFDLGRLSSTPSTSANVADICLAATHSVDFENSTTTVSPTPTYDQTSGKLSLNAQNLAKGSITVTSISITPQGEDAEAITGNITDDGSGNATFVGSDGTTVITFGTIDYAAGTITKGTTVATVTLNPSQSTTVVSCSTVSDVYRFVFAPQISAIRAKYSGSFGNNLMISISQINTSRLAESYQYASISVYYINQNVSWDSDGNATRTVLSTTLLENKIVTTNPNDPNYFEDVDFDFIEIVASQNARSELALVWSNIDSEPQSNLQYSGFPVIPFKYVTDSFVSAYNFDAMFGKKTYGTDFEYTQSVLDILKTGFKSYWSSANAGSWNPTKVNEYLQNVYGDNGIIQSIYTQLADVYQNFTDPYIYDFDFITSSGLVYRDWKLDDPETGEIKIPSATPSTTGAVSYAGVNVVHNSMRTLVETRQDCVALFDVPHNYDTKQIVEYSRMLNTSYGTMHFPWCYINSPDTVGVQLLMSPSYIFLYTFLSNLINNVESQKWFPPAGVSRATARVVVRPEYEIGSVILNAWQNDNTSRVNPIMKLKQYGYVIYGQYTTLEAIDLLTHSALESLNVRLIANVVKKKIFDACLNLAFEPNTSALWLKFFAQMDEYLRFMKYNDGLYDYRIVMDESTVTTDDINHLRCPGKVYIAPTRTAEFFDIDFIITGSGAEFSN